MSRLVARSLALLIVAAMLASPARAWAAVVPNAFGGKIACVEESDIQICRGTVGTRVETFDGVPLDVNLFLPAAATAGPYPLVVDLHGWSLGKSESPTYVSWAKAGWAVLSYTARGFHNSCGNAPSRMPDATLANPTVCDERG